MLIEWKKFGKCAFYFNMNFFVSNVSYVRFKCFGMKIIFYQSFLSYLFDSIKKNHLYNDSSIKKYMINPNQIGEMNKKHDHNRIYEIFIHWKRSRII